MIQWIHGCGPGQVVTMTGRVGPEPGRRLSDRELRIVRLLAAGSQPAQICAELGISKGTFKTRIADIRNKLFLHDAAGYDEIVKSARERGIIE